MTAATHALHLPPQLLEQGYWLYVWRVSAPAGELLYVGRTGDSSSPHASAPFKRLGQHLSHNDKQNPLRRYLEARGVAPETCSDFTFIAHGPVLPALQHGPDDDRGARFKRHTLPRDQIAALEKALADALAEAGYEVMNTVRCLKPLDPHLWREVRAAFAVHFPELANLPER